MRWASSFERQERKKKSITVGDISRADGYIAAI